MNKKKIIFYIILTFISVFIYIKYDKKDTYKFNSEIETFPPQNILDKLEDLEIQ